MVGGVPDHDRHRACNAHPSSPGHHLRGRNRAGDPDRLRDRRRQCQRSPPRGRDRLLDPGPGRARRGCRSARCRDVRDQADTASHRRVGRRSRRQAGSWRNPGGPCRRWSRQPPWRGPRCAPGVPRHCQGDRDHGFVPILAGRADAFARPPRPDSDARSHGASRGRLSRCMDLRASRPSCRRIQRRRRGVDIRFGRREREHADAAARAACAARLAVAKCRRPGPSLLAWREPPAATVSTSPSSARPPPNGR
jgi:hypothetical protein